MEEIKNIIIAPDISIKKAIKIMDTDGRKIVFVVDKSGKLMGTVTDGDVRRWILKGNSLEHQISEIMQAKPIVLYGQEDRENAKQLMLDHSIECIPIIDKDHNLLTAIWWKDFFEKKSEIRGKINAPIIVMAGGKGTRLNPFTNVLPKPLIPVGNKTIVERIIDSFIAYGANEFYISVNYKSNIIKAYFKDLNLTQKISFIVEEKPLGTGGSLFLLKKQIKETFFVTNCDILIEADYADIFKFHKENKNQITLVTSMKHFEISYGICNINKQGRLTEIQEKPEYDFLVNTGMYVLEPGMLNLIPENEFFHITDLINNCLKEDIKVGVYPISSGSWHDMGQMDSYQQLLQKFDHE